VKALNNYHFVTNQSPDCKIIHLVGYNENKIK